MSKQELSTDEIQAAIATAREHLGELVAESRSREIELYSVLRALAIMLEPHAGEQALRRVADGAAVKMHRAMLALFDNSLLRSASAVAQRAQALIPTASLELRSHLEHELMAVADPVAQPFTATEIANIEQRAVQVAELLGYPTQPRPGE